MSHPDELIASLREGAQAARREGRAALARAGQLANAAGTADTVAAYEAGMAQAQERHAAATAAFARAEDLEAEADRREAMLDALFNATRG